MVGGCKSLKVGTSYVAVVCSHSVRSQAEVEVSLCYVFRQSQL